MRDSLEDDLPREIVVRLFVEGKDHVGKAVERDGPHHHHVRHTVHLEFERKRDQAFDFFGGMVRPLRDQFDLGRRKIGISIHRHALERDDPSGHHKARQHQHQEPLTKGGLYDSMNHSELDATVLITVPCALVG